MIKSKAHAVVATSYNLHFGGKGEAQTPATAAKMARGDKLALCLILEKKGGSTLYTADDARAAYAALV